MVVTEGHCRKKIKEKIQWERPTSVWPKEHNTAVSVSGRTAELLKGRVRSYPIVKMPLDKNLDFVQDPK